MQRKRAINLWFKLIITIWLLIVAGCSLNTVEVVMVNNESLQKIADIHTEEPNGPLYAIENINEENYTQGRQAELNIKGAGLHRVKYHPLYSQSRPIIVEGKVGQEKKYPVVLDTGASVPIFVNDIHILENKLPIYPIKVQNGNSTEWGVCDLPELNIGEMTLINWPCFYQQHHAEMQLFGFPIAKDKAIIAGLPALKEFKYITFDSINKEVEFSLEKVFDPVRESRAKEKTKNKELSNGVEAEKSYSWSKYSFTIEQDLGGNAFLFVTIPIAGQKTELQLDTGSGRGLAIQEKLWEQIRQKIENPKIGESRQLYPYIGWLFCEYAVIPKLEVGNKTIKNAKISIFPDDSPLMANCQGLLGMQYFNDTVMVLDFERNLMWVKNPESS